MSAGGDNVQEARVDFVWNTDGVNAGAQKLSQASNNVIRDEQRILEATKAASAAASRAKDAAFTQEVAAGRRRMQAEGQLLKEQTSQAVTATKSMYAALDKADREYDSSLRARTKARYAEMDKSAQFRQAALVKSLRVTNDPALTGGSPAGGHGGIGGAGNARYIGDALDAATGSSGWVMRMRMLQHFGPAIGIGAAGVGGVGYLLNNLREKMGENGSESTRLQDSMGELTRASLFDNSSLGADALTERAKKFREQSEGEGVQQTAIGRTRDLLNSSGLGPNAFFDLVGGFQRMTGHRTLDEQARDSERREKAAQSGEGRARALRGESIADERSISDEATGGSSFRSRQLEINVERKGDRIKAQEGGYTDSEKADLEAKRHNEETQNNRAREQLNARTESEQRLAEFRGDAEARQIESARAARDLASETVRIVANGTQEEKDAANVRLKQAEQSLALAERESAERGVTRRAQEMAGGSRNDSARFALGQDTTSLNSNTRFLAGQNIQRERSAAAVHVAGIELAAAKARQQNNPGAAADHDVAMAQLAANAALTEQAQSEKNLGAATRDRINETFFTADGLPNRAGANEAERIRRQTQGRLERAGRRLAANGGLLDVHRDAGGRVIDGIDPITRERRAPRAADLVPLGPNINDAQRAAAAEAADRAHLQATVDALLAEFKSRLPVIGATP